jgi:hypothetical protein
VTPSQKKNDYAWLKPAISTDESRMSLTTLFYNVEKNELVATDGHRLHLVAPSEKLADVRYFINRGKLVPVSNSGDYGNFPPYSQVIPNYASSMFDFIKVSDVDVFYAINGKYVGRYKDVMFSMNYFIEAVAGNEEGFEIAVAGALDPIELKFPNSTRRAVIMPCRL